MKCVLQASIRLGYFPKLFLETAEWYTSHTTQRACRTPQRHHILARGGYNDITTAGSNPPARGHGAKRHGCECASFGLSGRLAHPPRGRQCHGCCSRRGVDLERGRTLYVGRWGAWCFALLRSARKSPARLEFQWPGTLRRHPGSFHVGNARSRLACLAGARQCSGVDDPLRDVWFDGARAGVSSGDHLRGTRVSAHLQQLSLPPQSPTASGPFSNHRICFFAAWPGAAGRDSLGAKRARPNAAYYR